MDRRDFIKKATMAAAGAAVISPVSAMLHQESNKKCKVLLVNGSPRTDGNTFCCLKEIEATLQKHGVESEIVQIGRKPVRMCINCGGFHRATWYKTSLLRLWQFADAAVQRPHSKR